MKKTIKTLLLAVLVVCTICVLTVMASATEGDATPTVVDSGYVMKYITYDESNPENNVENDGSANDVRWTLTSDGVLTISSTNSSEMKMNPHAGYSSAYNFKARIPWYTAHNEKITSVVVESSITYLNGACMLGYLPNCTSITFEAPSVKLNGSMICANDVALKNLKFAHEDYSSFEGQNVIDVRYFTGKSDQIFEGCCANSTVTVLLPYSNAVPFGTHCVFASTTKANFVVIPGSDGEKYAKESYPTATYRVYMPASNILSVESYVGKGIVVNGENNDQETKWTFDLDSGLLTFSWTGVTGSDNWIQFEVYASKYQEFAKAFGQYVKNVVFDYKFPKIYYKGDPNTIALFEGMTNLETVQFKSGQRIQNQAASTQGIFQGCTSLKAVTFGGELVDGVVDLSGANIGADDNIRYWLGNIINGCTSVEKLILPTNTTLCCLNASAIEGCTALKEVVIGGALEGEYDANPDKDIIDMQPDFIEEGVFDHWINSEEGYSALTVTFPLDSKYADSFESAGLLTVVAPVTVDASSGEVDQTPGNDNDLVWSYDETTKTLTISGKSTSIVWVDGKKAGWQGTANDYSMVPWFNKDIKVIEITAPITNIPDYMFGATTSVETVILPSTCVTLNVDAFVNCAKLRTLKTSESSPMNVIDLRSITTCDFQVFESCFDGEVEIWLPRTVTSFKLNDKFGLDSTIANFVVYPGSFGEEHARTMISSTDANVKGTYTYSYYTEEQSPEWYAEYVPTLSGSYTGQYGSASYAFDIETGVVTVTGSGDDANVDSKPWITMKNTWKYAIKCIKVLHTGKTTYNAEGSFSDLPELETIILSSSRMQGYPYFSNNPKLTTIGTSSTAVKGVVNLGIFQDINNQTVASVIYADMFANNTAITKLVLPTAGKSWKVTTIAANAFKGCTGITTITVPAGCGVTTIEDGAFSGLTTPVMIINEAADNTVANRLIEVLPPYSYIYKGASESGDDLTSVVTFDGWSVRTTGYNGLRGVFFASQDTIAENKANGWELVEYGALLSTTKSKEINGARVYYDGETITKDANVRVYPVESAKTAEKDLAKTLGNSDDDFTYFAVSVIKYSANYTTEVYMAGYEIWTKGDDIVIIYTDFATDSEHDERLVDASIYEVSIGMYMEGFMNSKIDEKGIVWDVLVNGGAVKLTKGTGYEVTHSKMAEGTEMKDLNGNAFGDTFVLADIPQCKTTYSNGVLSGFTANGTTLSVFQHPYKTSNYVLIHRSVGGSVAESIPASWDGIYAGQLASNWFSGSILTSVTAANFPNPIIKTNIWGAIANVVIDTGITTLGSMSYRDCGAQTYVYSEDLVKFADKSFESTNAIKTMYRAGDKAVVGRVDIHYLTSIHTQYTFDDARNVVEYWLPAGVKPGHEFFKANSKLTTVWFGDIANRIEGTINFTDSGLTALSGGVFSNCSNTITKVRLPDTITSIEDAVFGSITGLTIEQATFVQAIYDYCQTKGYTYTDLEGTTYVPVALEESEGWSGIIVK